MTVASIIPSRIHTVVQSFLFIPSFTFIFAFNNWTDNHRLLLIASGGDDNALSIIVTDFPYQNAEHGLPERSIHPPLRLVARSVISDAHDSLISGNIYLQKSAQKGELSWNEL